jgi:hypothetical protein
MNNVAKTTIAGIVTAASIGTGVLFFNAQEQETKSTTWNMPTIDVPELIIPSLPVYELANTDLINIDLLNNNQETDKNLLFTIDNLYSDFNNKIKFTDYKQSFDTFLSKYEDMQKFKNNVIDKRNLDYSSLANIDEWKQIYEKYQNIEPVKYIPLQGNFKIITEVRMPKSDRELNNLSKNLDFYKSKGYNSVLLCFRNGDDPYNIRQLARFIRNKNMYVFFAYGGEEKVNDDIYCDPIWFKDMLTNLAKESYGFMSWRRTSLHLWYPDEAWNNFVHHTIREANPNIFIIGEIYYGMTAINHPKIDWFFNIPKNCSAVMLKNFGYKGFYLENIVKIARIKGKIKNLPILAVVHGEKPYYATKNDTHKTFEENLKIKQEIEERFIKSGVQGTITMNDDGSDGIYNKKIVNNLSTYIINFK